MLDMIAVRLLEHVSCHRDNGSFGTDFVIFGFAQVFKLI